MTYSKTLCHPNPNKTYTIKITQTKIHVPSSIAGITKCKAMHKSYSETLKNKFIAVTITFNLT
jgi:hypothetical protein